MGWMMNTIVTRWALKHATQVLCCANIVLLSACGGGGSSSSTGTPPPSNVTPAPAPTPTTLSGTVAVGAPMLNAVITIKDANGVIKTVNAGADGSYSGISMDGMVAPFSVQACGIVDGNNLCFYSVVHAAGVANVTPLTNADVALALGSDPADIFATNSPKAPPSAADLEAQKQKLKTALASILAKAGITEADFATTPFTADRTGMDKVLDSVKVSTGTDGATNKSFVQLEGIIGSGNAFLDKDAAAGSLSAGNEVDVDLKGISRLFVDGLSFAVSAPDQATCESRLAAADVFDDSFSLNFDEGVTVNKTTAPSMICQFAGMSSLFGGKVANPSLHDCDFTSDVTKKICTVGFNIVHGETSFDGAELAVILRPGATWKILGRESGYEIHVGAAIQRTIRVDLPVDAAAAQPQYTRAISFDISGSDGTSNTGVRAAKVYQRNLDGSGWEATPLATLTLTDACIAQFQNGQKPRLGIVGSSCGSSWLSLGDTGASADAAAQGDQLIDNFYKRGRKVKIELYSNVAATGTHVDVIKRVEGVPPKYAALATFPWLEMDAATKTALVAYDGTANTFDVSWAKNRVVGAKDVSLCLAGGCDGNSQGGHDDVLNGHNSQTIHVNHKPASANAFKMIGLYGRNSDQLGVSSNYLSCGGASTCF